MRLLADKKGLHFLNIIKQRGDVVVVQFITELGKPEGKVFNESLKGLMQGGWTARSTSTAIGLDRFRKGFLEDAQVSYALHHLYPLGREVRVSDGRLGTIASYANTHADGYYMYLTINQKLIRLQIKPDWQLLASRKLLALPFYPAPKSKAELLEIERFTQWSGGF